MDKDSVYRIGRIGKPHGVKGELTLLIDDDVFDRVEAPYVFVETEGLLVPFFIEEYRFRTDTTVLMKFCDVDTEAAARELSGCEVWFPRSLSDDDEAPSQAEIIGYTVVDAKSGRKVGTIDAVDDSTINTLFEVSRGDGGSVLLPANPELVEDVDRQASTIRLTIADGLLDDSGDTDGE